MEILIVGAGIGGLAAAISLERAGHDVGVLERSADPSEVGAGLVLWPNARRALHRLGIPEPRGCPVTHFEIRDQKDRVLTVTPIEDFSSRHGYPLTMVHRSELQADLLDRLGNARVRYGWDAVHVEQQANRVQVHLRSGEQLGADLVIGADGLRSAVRRSLLDDGPPRFSGATCWRGVCTFDMTGRRALNWMGSGGEFGLFPLTGGRVYWFGVRNRPEGETDAADGRKAEVLREFAEWPDPIVDVLEATPREAVLRNDLYDRPPARRWSRDRVALVGDAAHPMLPNVGQGACQAIEDASVLGTVVDSGRVEDSLREYESRRIGIANRLMFQARQSARLVQSTNPIVRLTRDFAFAHLPRALLVRQLDAMFQES